MWLPALCLALLVPACEGPGPKKIGDVTLAVLMMGGQPVPPEAAEAPVVKVMPGQTPVIPAAKVVKLAIDRKVTWGLVKAIAAAMEAKGQTPVFLVAKQLRVQAFHFSDPLKGPHIEVLTYTDGKLCVKHPDVAEAKCSQTLTKNYIDAAFTRELVREAVRGYQRADVIAELPDALTWADVVSAVGGARSCCDQPVRVRILGSESPDTL